MMFIATIILIFIAIIVYTRLDAEGRRNDYNLRKMHDSVKIYDEHETAELLGLPELEDSDEAFRIVYSEAQRTMYFVPIAIDNAYYKELKKMRSEKQDWQEVTDKMTAVSQTFYDKGEEGYTLELVNPERQNHTLLAVKDGEITYSYL